MNGNLFESKAQVLVNAVNCVGVMGKGIALEFKNRFPEVYRDYKAACDAGRLSLGTVYAVQRAAGSEPAWIFHFPTKDHFRDRSKYASVENGLVSLHQLIVEKNIESIALPALGCGLGGLQWERVKPMIETALADLKSVRILVYAPQ